MKWKMHAVVGILAVFAAALVRAENYVAQNGQVPAEPYDSWSNAASNIQDVLTYVGDVEVTIHVGAGHYGPPPGAVDWNGPNVVYHSRALTLLSSNNVPGSVRIDGGGTHRGIGLLRGGFIAGITVTNGYSSSTTHGGGIRTESDLIVSNCVVVGNASDGRGGGVYAHRGAMDFVDSHITHNRAVTDGGGVGMDWAGAMSFIHCVIAHNEANNGGGMHNQNNLTIENSTIEQNVATTQGGGIRKLYGSLLLRNSIVRGNVVINHGTNEGGNAMSLQRTIADIINCLIVENCNSALSPYANAFFNIPSPDAGLGHMVLRLFNCTLAYHDSGSNHATYDQWIRFRRDPSTDDNHPSVTNEFHIHNTILYYNRPSILVPANTDLYFSHNCTDIDLSAYPGGNHVTEPPEFAHAAQGDYRLSGGSPCIDAGNNDYVQTAVDLDGKKRIDSMSGIVDIGAYEYLRKGTTILLR